MDNYTDLSEAILAYLNRADLAERVPTFVRLTEARLNRLLRDPEQLVTANITFTAGKGTLPTDFGEIVAFNQPGWGMTQLTPGEFATRRDYIGGPRPYTVIGGSISILPAEAGTIPLTYYRSIPPLSADNPTNWLLTRAPDVYLYGALLQAEFYGWNDERLGTIKQAYDEAVGELITDGSRRRWSTPLGPQVSRP